MQDDKRFKLADLRSFSLRSPEPQSERRLQQPSRIAVAAAGLGGLRESLFSVVLGSAATSGAPEIEFTLPPSGTPPFSRRSPAAELGGSSPDVSISGPSSRATSPVPGACTPPRGASASPSTSTNELRVTGFPLGSINPALYKGGGSEERLDTPECGQVWLSLSYEEAEERLQVTVQRASALRHPPDTCLPIARLCLLPDERRYQQTRLRKRTSSPHFNEQFYFQVAARELSERTLRVTFLDLERRQKSLGHVSLPLRDLQLGVTQREFQLELQAPGSTACPGPCPGPCSRGPREAGITLLLALSFSPALERLNVSILEARLAQTSALDGADLYGRASLVQQARVVKSKRTGVVKKASAPGTARFNESFSFHVPPATLDTCSLAVHVMRHATPLSKDQSVGRVVLGSNMFARGSGLEHWRRMLAAPAERVQQWHCLVKDQLDP